MVRPGLSCFLSVALFFAANGVVSAYEVKKDLPPPDFSGKVVMPDYKKVWGKKYAAGLHSLRWNESHGWKEIIPGQTSIAKAIEKLGQPEYSIDDVAGVSKKYSFNNGVSITAKGLDALVEVIEVFPTQSYQPNFPLTARDAETMYGPISRRDRIDGDVTSHQLERKGLTIPVDSNDDNGQVHYLRFTPASNASVN